jgi:hypothetical protein
MTERALKELVYGEGRTLTRWRASRISRLTLQLALLTAFRTLYGSWFVK